MQGDWPQVAEQAGETPVILFSSNTLYRQQAKEMGVKFIDKMNFNPEELVAE